MKRSTARQSVILNDGAHAKKLELMRKASRCINNARELLGPGWKHVGPHIRWGLVSAQLLAEVEGGMSTKDTRWLIDSAHASMEMSGDFK